MSPDFEAKPRLLKKAKDIHTNQGFEAVKRWWCNKYGLPLTSPQFQDQTEADLMIEYYADQYAKLDEVRAQIPREKNLLFVSRLKQYELALAELLDEPSVTEKKVYTGDEWFDRLSEMNPEDVRKELANYGRKETK